MRLLVRATNARRFWIAPGCCRGLADDSAVADDWRGDAEVHVGLLLRPGAAGSGLVSINQRANRITVVKSSKQKDHTALSG